MSETSDRRALAHRLASLAQAGDLEGLLSAQAEAVAAQAASPTPDPAQARRLVALAHEGDLDALEAAWHQACASADGVQTAAVAFLGLWTAFAGLVGADVAASAALAALGGDASALQQSVADAVLAGPSRRERRAAIRAARALKRG